MSVRKVPFFNYPSIFTTYEEEFVKIFKDVGRRGAFIMQKDLLDFEKNLAKFTGSKYAIGVANATDGLQIMLMAGGVGPGDEVIISSHTMVATGGAVHFAGAKVVPVEAGYGRNIDVNAIEAAITPKTKAIMPTQLNGRCSDMDALQKLADKHNLLIFEDSAQALGAKFKGKCAGNFGVAGAISFYPAKVMGCFGDAGAILLNDDKVYDEAMKLRDHGRREDGEIVAWGFNSRLDNLQAAFLNFQLEKYPDVIKRRREIAGMYHERLHGISDIGLPPAPDENEDYFDVYQNYEVLAKNRDQLKTHLGDNEIGTIIQWGGKAVHQWEQLGFTQSLPNTDKMFEELLLLPLNMSMDNDDVQYVCDKIEEFYK